MLAYVSWHRPAAAVEEAVYERALEHFHRSLAHRPPAGFRCSAAFRATELPWIEGDAPGYEDWYLLEDWTAIGVLEEAAVSVGHASVHDQIASRAALSTSSVYRLLEGTPQLGCACLAAWVTPARGRERLSLETLLGDGIQLEHDSLWRRCLGLGPAPEYCLLASERTAGVAAGRLPKGWSAATHAREPVWRG